VQASAFRWLVETKRGEQERARYATLVALKRERGGGSLDLVGLAAVLSVGLDRCVFTSHAPVTGSAFAYAVAGSLAVQPRPFFTALPSCSRLGSTR
jgi:hypothetical protein